MSCNEYQEQVSQYIDGELGDERSGTLFKHVGTCAECRSFMRSTLVLRSKIHDETLMEREMQEEIVRTKSAGSAIKPALLGRRISLSPAVAASVLMLVIMITALVVGSGGNQKPIESSGEVVYVTSLPTIEVQGFSAVERDGKQ